MSHHEDLLERTEQAWTTYRSELADRIYTHDEFDHVLLELDVPERLDTPCGPYVQVGWSGDGDIVAEVSSNHVLDPKFRIRKPERRLLRKLGWTRPDDDHPNYWIHVDPAYADKAAAMLVRALREVFDVIHPAFLIDRFHEDTDPAVDMVATTHQLADAVTPDDEQHLNELVDIALGPDWGSPLPTRDDDGDIPYLCDGAVVFVRVLHRTPVIRVFCELVVDVTDLDAAAFEVAVLNREHSAVKFVLYNNFIVMSVDLPAMPFVPHHLRTAVAAMCELAPELIPNLAHRVGGQGFVEQSPDRPL
jgi:hypothetical protein